VIQSEKKELQTFKSGKPTLFNKKLEKKNVSKKVVYDMNSLKVYDLDIYLSNKKLVELGSIGYQGKLI
jgi:hypothetical protein